ncbi:MAG: hypothetical protein Q9179_002268 [Wetmoreana sp. 5 TL-2023]
MELGDQKAQNARVEKLWRKLDTQKQGHLDAKGLKKGLKEIDHPLKNADEMLQDVLKALDTDGDGRIQYTEFRAFVEQTEKELLKLFKSIDRDHNGQLDKNELKLAFTRAGLAVPNSKLDQFFSEVDTNSDGVISFEEWRDFLLFIPATTPNLRAVLSYYSSTVTVNAEGDVHVSDNAVEGIGRSQFPSSFIESLLATFRASPPDPRSKTAVSPVEEAAKQQAWIQSEHCCDLRSYGDHSHNDPENFEDFVALDDVSNKNRLLTDISPPLGYFLAGGIAGVVSRTATAPLDRLKVYLIAQTSVKDKAINAAKSGAPIRATKHASRPLIEASKTLWRMGGIRSLFAG